MTMELDPRAELQKFEELYERKYDRERASRRDAWNHRAEEWDRKYRDERESELHEVRVRDTAAWLRQRGLLTAEQDVADVGCGPGRFAAEFARTARSVFGTDISSRMTELGGAYCQEQGLMNVRFQPVDFQHVDVGELGWDGKFDLVFSSITPAVSGRKGLDNLVRMSRAWCFNASFVYSVNALHSDLMHELFDREPKRNKTSHSHWFYELFSLLWFRGYYPESHYYKQYREQRLGADRATAERLTDFLLEEGEFTEDNTRRILRWLEEHADADGYLTEVSDCWYGWLLWDVRDRQARAE